MISASNGSARDLSAQLRPADRTPNDERPRGADVDGTQVAQLSGEHRWAEGSVPTDVVAPEQNDECHAAILLLTSPAPVGSQ
jgi:hypothetical protein